MLYIFLIINLIQLFYFILLSNKKWGKIIEYGIIIYLVFFDEIRNEKEWKGGKKEGREKKEKMKRLRKISIWFLLKMKRKEKREMKENNKYKNNSKKLRK